jgi:hypothetical protein
MDQLPGNLPVSQAEAIRERTRKLAIFSSGHKFIWLTLKPEKVRYRRLSGVEIVHSVPYLDEMAGNVPKFQFSVKGGVLDFEFDESRGQFRFPLLDSEHNRRFLASHFHVEAWDIEDEKVREDIAARSKEIEKAMKKAPKKPEVANPAEIKEATPEEVAAMPAPKMEPIGSDLVTPRAVGVLAP